ncbi:hypothetical protein HYS95_03605 [Candidatus Daviesbacteria bacterium]|nr:hypothetical protein [Candidatus Daviesbacteria bacterium]
MLKKLIFAPFFLLTFILLIYQLNPLLSSYDFVFVLSADTLIELIKIAALFVLSSLLFSLFATFANGWKLILPVSLLAAAIPLLFINTALAIVLTVTIIISLLLTYLALENNLKSYLTFKASALIGPAVRHLSALLIASFCIVYFLSANQIIAQKGFEIPDSLIDTAISMSPAKSLTEQSQTEAQLPSINSEQLELLKQNPDMLKQYGLDPQMLDTLTNPQKTLQAPQNLLNDTIKQTVKDQFQTLIKPYQSFIPAILALILFLTLQSLTAVLSIFISPVLWLIFTIFEKTAFVKFEIEQRPVKKLVI